MPTTISGTDGVGFPLGGSQKDGRNSIAESGYTTLPGGLILQWITTVTTGGSGNQTVTFPIPFPNAFFGAVFGSQHTTSGNMGNEPTVITSSLTGLTYQNNNSSTPSHTDRILVWGM